MALRAAGYRAGARMCRSAIPCCFRKRPDDPEAFWVTATGPSMVPEGIEAGCLCLVSPSRDIAPGDRVWIRDITGAAAIKRLVSIEDDGRLMLRGWQDFRQGRQQSFDEERFPAGIDRVHPVIAVFKGKPGDERFEHVPDPMGACRATGGSTARIDRRA